MTLPPFAVTQARLALRRALVDVPPGATVAVACSGGADSLALVAELVFVARSAGWRTAAFLVDHAMQEGSAEVTHNAALTCERLGVDIVATARVTVETGTGSGGPENAARNARYLALENMAKDHNAHAVLLGHTLDDQAETVLLGLHRGSGARSLAGMKPVKGVFRRPYLGLTREHTEQICAHSHVEFWVDPTNLDVHDGPLRSQVRGRLLPLLDEILGPRIAETLARTAELLQDDADALDQWASDALVKAQVSGNFQGGAVGAAEKATVHANVSAKVSAAADNTADNTQPHPGATVSGPANVVISSENSNATQITLRVDLLKELPNAVRTRALRKAILLAGTPAGPLKYSHIQEVDKLITNWHGQGPIDLPDRFTARRESGNVSIKPPTL